MIEDHSGIDEEWLAETEGLLEKAYKTKDRSPVEIILSSSPFFRMSESEGKLKITGIALAEGVWKNVLYPAEELQKAASRLQGKPLMVEHGLDNQFKKEKVGDVIFAQYDPMLKSIVFQADVTNPDAIALVKDGTFPAVSCSTWLDKYPLNSDESMGFNFKFNELSLVKEPACEKCFIFAVEQLSKHFQDGNDHGHKDMTNLELGEIKMNEEKDTETIEELEEDFDLSELEKPNLYAVIECDSMENLGEDLKKKAVSYYYGYKYPAPNAKAKYPYPKYPYYPYVPQNKSDEIDTKYPAYKYPYGYPQKKSLFVLIQLESPEEVLALQQSGKKLVSVYYGYYGYPYGQYPYYGKGYPHGYPQKQAAPKYPAPDEKGNCPDGFELDPKEKVCKPVQKDAVPKYPAPDAQGKCPDGFVLDPKDNTCKPAPPKGQDYPAPPVGGSELCPECDELLSSLEDLAIPKPYLDFMKKCMKESKTMPVIKRMKECAAAYKKQAQTKSTEKNASPEFTDMEPEAPKVIIGPTLDATVGASDPAKDFDVQGKEMKLNKDEMLSTTPVKDMTEPCKECPKKEETSTAPAVAPKEEPKVEAPKVETPKVETPKIEPSKIEPQKEETPKVGNTVIEHKVVIEIKQAETPKDVTKEAPKVESPKVEEPKVATPVEEPKKEVVPEAEPPKTEAPKAEPQLSPEEIEKYVKENYPEIFLELIRKKKFP